MNDDERHREYLTKQISKKYESVLKELDTDEDRRQFIFLKHFEAGYCPTCGEGLHESGVCGCCDDY